MTSDAALILGIFLLLSSFQMGNSRVTVKLDDPDKISYAYCAGMKTGEAIRGALK